MNEARRQSCVELIRKKSSPLNPLPPPDLDARLEQLLFPACTLPFRGIKAVLFDVYGTLFCSAAGDIGSGTGRPGADKAQAAGDTARALDELAARTSAAGTLGEDLTDYFRKAVLASHEAARRTARGTCRRLRSGKDFYPEVRVEAIWDAFPKRRRETPAETMALEYELIVNPVYPMPGAKEIILALKREGLVLGIVSNAQFFTPLLFDACLGASPEELGFSPELLIYSYKEEEAKPSPSLFSRALALLEGQGIAADSAVYIGNDMRNDIRAAASAGFKTVLFAGDARSLRLRREDPPGRDPGRIIRRLTDLAPLVVS